MFLRIAGAQSAEQSGIRGVKRPFDPNIMTLVHRQCHLVKRFPGCASRFLNLLTLGVNSNCLVPVNGTMLLTQTANVITQELIQCCPNEIGFRDRQLTALEKGSPGLRLQEP